MKEFIIVGGPGRAGTTTTATYLHLSNEIFSFTGGEKSQCSEDFEHFVSVQIPTIARFGSKNNDKMVEFFKTKNEDHRSGIIDKYPYLARKMEHVELSTDRLFFFENIGYPIKFIFCMRRDFHNLFRSRIHDEDKEDFTLNCLESMREMQRIAKIYPSCCIDVSETPQEDYKRVDSMLGLEPSVWQKWFRENNPAANWRTYKKSAPKLPDELSVPLVDMYDETRKILCL